MLARAARALGRSLPACCNPASLGALRRVSKISSYLAFGALTGLFWGCGGGGAAEAPNSVAAVFNYDENPANYLVGRSIAPNRHSMPPAAGVRFEANPALPAGLELDAETGVLRGVPTGPTGSGVYRVVRHEGAAAVSAELSIQITDPIVLVDAATAEAPVYWWGDEDDRAAAEMLASYLNRISGRTGFVARAGPRQLPARALLVGRVPYPGFELSASGAEDEFVMRAKGDCIQLTGRVGRSTSYAVSAYLERCLDCRFWAVAVPSTAGWEEDVPSAFPLVSPRPNLRVRPAFEKRDVGSQESHVRAYGLRRMTTNGYSPVPGAVEFTADHNMHTLVESPAYGAYAANHPEIYPCANPGPGTLAERARNNIHLCYTDPGLPQALADALSKDVEARGRDLKHWIYFAGQGDWYGGHCECDRCRAVHTEETWVGPTGASYRGYSGTLIRMMNRVAEILDAKYPGIRVGTFAYMGTEAPCGLTRPRANLAIQVPHLRHCIVHAMDECLENRRYWNNLRGWLARDQGGGVYVWDYSQMFDDGFWYSAPNVYSVARSIKACAAAGVRGTFTQGNYASSGGDLTVMKNWLYGKLMVDPRLDVDEVLEEFCRGYYGAAGDAILAYVRAIRDSVYDPAPIHHHDEFARIGTMRASWLSPALLARLRALRADALAAVSLQPLQRKRVLEATVGVLAYDLYVPLAGSSPEIGFTGPLSEGVHEGRTVLIRDNVGRYTYDEMTDLLANARGGSPSEWGSGEALSALQLSYQGGPLVVLASGSLTAKLAPAIKGQLRQLVFRGVPCLHVASIADNYLGYPAAGSSMQVFSIQNHTWEVVGTPTGTSASIQSKLGLGNWELSHLIGRNTYSVGVDASGRSTVVMDGTVEDPAYQERRIDTVQCSIETVYEVSADPASHSLTTDVQGGVATVRLPGQTWVIRDAYSGATVRAITSLHDATRKTLTVRVELAVTTAVGKGSQTPYVKRTITFVDP